MSGAGFWDRRKAAVAQEALAEQEALRAAAAAEAEADLEARDDAEILDELGLPEPEALDSPDAVRDFLNSAVPQRLKTRALRRLWRLNPVLANLDGLLDYGEDYTDAANVVENLQTAYQVGKGMLSHIEALAAKADAEEMPATEEADTDEGEADAPEGAEIDAALLARVEAAQEQADLAETARLAETPQNEADTPPAARRRMRFQFETTA